MPQETSLIGQFLIAMPGMDDERFKKSVILITSYSDEGAKGLIINKPTDILSFPFQKKIKLKDKLYLGDIIISYNFMNIPKNQNNSLFKDKVIKTFIHGFLHLLSFDHIKLKDYKKMLKEEEEFRIKDFKTYQKFGEKVYKIRNSVLENIRNIKVDNPINIQRISKL